MDLNIWSQMPSEITERIIASTGNKYLYKSIYNTECIRKTSLDIIRSVAVNIFSKERPCHLDFCDYLFMNVKIVVENEIRYKQVIDLEFIRKMFLVYLNTDQFEELYHVFMVSFPLMTGKERIQLATSVIQYLSSIENYIFKDMNLSILRCCAFHYGIISFDLIDDMFKFIIFIEIKNTISDNMQRDFFDYIWKKKFTSKLEYSQMDQYLYFFRRSVSDKSYINHIKHLELFKYYTEKYINFQLRKSAYFGYFRPIDENNNFLVL